MRLRREPVPILTILEENSTPMVCEERTRPVGQSLVRQLVWNVNRRKLTFILDEAME